MSQVGRVLPASEWERSGEIGGFGRRCSARRSSVAFDGGSSGGGDVLVAPNVDVLGGPDIALPVDEFVGFGVGDGLGGVRWIQGRAAKQQAAGAGAGLSFVFVVT